ncbi:unnamed protein product [Cyprideis torosa]|uniref:Uncharacterized protein n=1 Tax=Cyprideis torosa TaxID=163714 RepID=A0A7R8W2L1_9CRUS|nr:unnamed protein product [Cyprideis torosa]CAG0881993.1 unnamed protein product [Cyprideis torosa]
MSENNTSGLRLVEKVVRVPVHPKHGCDIIGGIKEILDGRINTYHPGLGGILLDYSLLEIQPIAHNSISGMLYVPVHGRFQVFNVKPGDRLTGICTSVYSLKTGCHLIDVPVNGVHVKVRHPKEDPKVSEGDTVICEVTEARLSERMPLIRAKLVSVRANLPPVERVSEGDDDGSESGISSGSFHTEEEESSSIRTEDDETENRISGWFNATPQIRIKGKLNKYGRSSSDEEDDVSPPQNFLGSGQKLVLSVGETPVGYDWQERGSGTGVGGRDAACRRD